MANELQTAFNEIAELRALPQDVIIEALQSALVSAYRRDSGASAAQGIEARIDPNTGRAKIFVEKEVSEDIINPSTEVTLEKARFYEPEAQLGDMVMVQVEGTTKKFGRIAAQTAKQVILQKIREAERNSLYDEFVTREGDLITGTVQSVNAAKVILSLGRAEAELPRGQQIPGERYRTHEKLRVLLLEVKKQSRGPQIIASRSHRNMLRRLLEYEVPEIYNGQVEIKSIAREAGYRSKVAVAALQEGIDPVGACVGMRGIRIQNIVKELHDEKIDVIEWSVDAEAFIQKALSPARVTGVYLEDDALTGRTAVVVVPDEQLSLAIGREGQNARLAAKLTGWRIDIKSVTETVQGALDKIETPPLADLMETHPELIAEVLRIMDKKADQRTVMPEEYNTLGRFADLVETRLLARRQPTVDQAQYDTFRMTLPPELFELPLITLGLSDELYDALEPLGSSIGDVILALLVDEERVRNMVAGLPGDPMEELQTAMDLVMSLDEDEDVADMGEALAEATPVADLAEASETPEQPLSEDDPISQTIAEVDAFAARMGDTSQESPAAELSGPAQADEAPAAMPETPSVPTAQTETTDAVEIPPEVEEDEVLLDAFGGRVQTEPQSEPEATEPEEAEEKKADDFLIPDYDFELDEAYEAEAESEGESEDEVDESGLPRKKKKKSRQKRRQLVYDEDSGQVIAKRRRKGNRKRGDWDDYEF